MTAYDSVAAGSTGLPWPDLNDAGAVSLLQTLRTAAGPRTTAEPALSIALPVPGDVRGLPAGTTFARDAVATGEALVVTSERGTPVGLVPDFEFDDSDGDYAEPVFEQIPDLCALSWTVYSLPTAPVPEHLDLGDAEFTLRSAVRSAADALGRLRAGGTGVDVDDPRGLIEQLMDSARAHRAPDHAPVRALRVLENAAHVDAIITVSAGLMPIATQSSSEAQIAGDALRPLVRSGPIGKAGRGRRDPALGLAALASRVLVCTAVSDCAAPQPLVPRAIVATQSGVHSVPSML